MPKDVFEPEDPMALTGVALPGDSTEEMAECFVEEFVRMGYSDLEIFYFFKSPQFIATHKAYQDRGEAYVKDVIARIRSVWQGGRHGKGP